MDWSESRVKVNRNWLITELPSELVDKIREIWAAITMQRHARGYNTREREHWGDTISIVRRNNRFISGRQRLLERAADTRAFRDNNRQWYNLQWLQRYHPSYTVDAITDQFSYLSGVGWFQTQMREQLAYASAAAGTGRNPFTDPPVRYDGIWRLR